MQSTTQFIGLDVSKGKIAVAIAEAGREEPRWYGTIPLMASLETIDSILFVE
ncbi:hypothetical protein D3C85_1854180 [compost metagenome]